MRHKKLAQQILTFFFAPLVVITVLFAVFRKDDARPKDPVEIVSPKGDIIVTFIEQIIEEKEKLYEVRVSYPEVSGISFAADSRITNDIRLRVTAMVDEFVKRESVSEYAFSDLKSTLETEYRELPPVRGVLSIPILVSEYSSGAAHPNSFMLAANYDVATGEPLTLEDLFAGSGFLSRISVLARDGLEKIFTENEWTPSEWSDEGTAPLAENYRDFYVDGDNLVIIFNPYQVAPYVYGIIEVPIPFAELSNILKPAYR